MELNSIEEVVEDLKKGKCVVIMDDENRENEGDVICAAEFATTENVNFMASYAKGLICMPMAPEYTDKLHLPQMCITNTDNHCTAFSVSVDHVSTTTGISAYERGITARKFVEDDAKPEDFRRPGHMFPLEARPGGVIERQGHTEATVDLMKIAGLKPVGLCCEIMRDDGMMARRDDLEQFAKQHDLSKIPEEHRPLLNPTLELSGIYFMQELRRPVEKEQHGNLRELEEELLVNMRKSQYLVAMEVNEENPKQIRIPYLKNKNEEILQPVFTDVMELEKFTKGRKLRIAKVPLNKLPELMIQQAKAYVVNPMGFNLVLTKEQLEKIIG